MEQEEITTKIKFIIESKINPLLKHNRNCDTTEVKVLKYFKYKYRN